MKRREEEREKKTCSAFSQTGLVFRRIVEQSFLFAVIFLAIRFPSLQPRREIYTISTKLTVRWRPRRPGRGAGPGVEGVQT